MMDWNQLRERWQTSTNAEAPVEAVEALRARDQKLRNTVKRRDLLETGVALLMMPFFVGLAWFSASSDHWVRAGFALFLGLWAGFVPVRLWLARKRMPTPHPESSLREYLAEERAALIAQARMLESIWIWYLGPCAFGVLGLTFSTRAPTLGTWIYAVIVLGFCAVLGRANHDAARTKFRAMADDIGRQLHTLNKEPDA